MAIQQAQAKFYQAFKLQISIKSASANLTASISTNVVGTKVLRSINNRFSVNSSVSADGKFAIKGGLIKGNQGLRAVTRLQLRFPTFVKIDIDQFNLPEGANVTLQLEPGFVIEQTDKFPFALGAPLGGVELLTFNIPKRFSTQMLSSTTLNAEGRVFDNIKLDSQFVLSASGGLVYTSDIPNFSAISSSSVSATRNRVISSNITSASSITFDATVFDPEMVLVYNTSLFDTSNTIILPLANIEDSVTVNWGDGTSDTYTTPGNYGKTYGGLPGARTVRISGGLLGYGSGNNNAITLQVVNSNRNLTSVTWFNPATTDFSNAFNLATNLTSVPTVLPLGVVGMAGMFNNASSFNYDISDWNVSTVNTMNSMFSGATAFNQNISKWNVSSVGIMTRLFQNATSFNQDISSWNVSNVGSLPFMFENATSFNQNLSNWTVGTSLMPTGFSTGANATFANNANLLKPFLSNGTRITT